MALEGTEQVEIVDVRPENMVAQGVISGSKNVMLKNFFDPATNLVMSKEEVLAALSGVDLSKPVICQCQSGLTSTYLYAALCHHGIVEHPSLLDGGYGYFAGRKKKQ